MDHTVEALRHQIASLMTKHGNNEAAMVVVLGKWGADIGALQQKVEDLCVRGHLDPEARKVITEGLNEISQAFNGIRSIGIADLHAFILEGGSDSSTPQAYANDYTKNFVKPVSKDEIGIEGNGTVTVPVVESRQAGENEIQRRANSKTTTEEVPALVPRGKRVRDRQ